MVLKPLGRRLGAQRSDLRRHPRQRRQPERHQQRPDRPQPRGPGASAPRSLRAGEVSPGLVQFVETQGTGTPLGDAIEAAALGNVLRRRPPAGQPLRHRLGEDQPRPHGSGRGDCRPDEGGAWRSSIASCRPICTSKRRIPTFLSADTAAAGAADAGALAGRGRSRDWPASARLVSAAATPTWCWKKRRRPPWRPPAGEERAWRLLPLSARTEKALHDLAERYAAFLRDDPPAWSDVCYTAARRRDHHDCRLTVRADSPETAADLLDAFLRGQTRDGIFTGRKPYGHKLRIAFLYDDRAENWKPYARQLARAVPGFAEVAEGLDAPLDDDARWDDPTRATAALLALQMTMTAWCAPRASCRTSSSDKGRANWRPPPRPASLRPAKCCNSPPGAATARFDRAPPRCRSCRSSTASRTRGPISMRLTGDRAPDGLAAWPQ